MTATPQCFWVQRRYLAETRNFAGDAVVTFQLGRGRRWCGRRCHDQGRADGPVRHPAGLWHAQRSGHMGFFFFFFFFLKKKKKKKKKKGKSSAAMPRARTNALIPCWSALSSSPPCSRSSRGPSIPWTLAVISTCEFHAGNARNVIFRRLPSSAARVGTLTAEVRELVREAGPRGMRGRGQNDRRQNRSGLRARLSRDPKPCRVTDFAVSAARGSGRRPERSRHAAADGRGRFLLHVEGPLGAFNLLRQRLRPQGSMTPPMISTTRRSCTAPSYWIKLVENKAGGCVRRVAKLPQAGSHLKFEYILREAVSPVQAFFIYCSGETSSRRALALRSRTLRNAEARLRASSTR